MDLVKLKTLVDHNVFFANKNIALMLLSIAPLVLSSEHGEVIDVPAPVSRKTLEIILKWLEKKMNKIPQQQQQVDTVLKHPNRSIPDEDKTFLNSLDDDTFFSLFIAVDCLQVERLAKLCSSHLTATILDLQSADDIRERFHLDDGFTTPKEREKIEAEVHWSAPDLFFSSTKTSAIKRENMDTSKLSETIQSINGLLTDSCLLQVFREIPLQRRLCLRAVNSHWNELIIDQCSQLMSNGLIIHIYEEKVEREAAKYSDDEPEMMKVQSEDKKDDFYQQFLATSLPPNFFNSDGSSYSSSSSGVDGRPKNLFYCDNIETECCNLPRPSFALFTDCLLEIELSMMKIEKIPLFSDCLSSCFDSVEGGDDGNCRKSLTIFCPKLPIYNTAFKLDVLLAAIVNSLPSLTSFTLWVQKYWETGFGSVELTHLLTALNKHIRIRELAVNASLSTAYIHEEDLLQTVDISPLAASLQTASLGVPLLHLNKIFDSIGPQMTSLKINCSYETIFKSSPSFTKNNIRELSLANFCSDDLPHVAKLFPSVRTLTLLIPSALLRVVPTDLSTLRNLRNLTQLNLITSEFDYNLFIQRYTSPHHLPNIRKLAIISSINGKCISNFLYEFYGKNSTTLEIEKFDCERFVRFLKEILPNLEHLFIFGGVTNYLAVKQELEKELHKQYYPNSITCKFLFHEMKYRKNAIALPKTTKIRNKKTKKY